MIVGLLIAAGVLTFIPIRNKSYKILVLIVELLVMVMLFAGNNVTRDQMAYALAYRTGDVRYFEVGYLICNNLARRIGLDYAQFKICISLILIMLIKKGFHVLDIKLWISALMTWILTSFAFETEQSRFFIAAMIVVYGLNYLNRENIRFNDLAFYIVCVGIASTFHTSSIVYMIFLLIPLMKIPRARKIIYSFICIVVVIMIASALNGNDWSFIGNILFSITGNERIRMWFGFSTRFGYLECVYFQCLMFVLIWYAYESIKSEMIPIYEKDFCLFVKNVYLLLFYVMPLYMISTDFVRLERGLFLLGYLAIWIGIKRIKSRRRFVLLFGMIAFAVSYNMIMYGNFVPFENDYYNDIITKNIWS